MTQRKVKKEVILISSLVLLLLSTLTAIELKQGSKKEEPKYVNKTIFENDIPVISEKEIISRPYTDNAVRLVKSYYEKSDDEEKQKNSLIFYENTYLPSTGADYQADYNFDIVSILDGEVLKVTEDQILGNIVEIKHNDDIISSYQSLSEVTVKEGDHVTRGQIIGKSGESNIEKDLGSHLHFELTIKNQTVNPEEYYEKELGNL